MKFINFNNAGSSFPSKNVNNSINKFLKYEEKYGGYYASEKFSEKLDTFYENLSILINCKKHQISFLPSTTYALNIFFNSLNFPNNKNIVIFENEYGSNFIYFKKRELNLRVVKIKNNGEICFKDLEKKIDSKTIFISVCHIASQCGEIIDIQKIGKIAKKINPNIIFIVDACQSVGHIKLDVKKIQCDVLVGSGRKYLRGPRGTGFIFFKDTIKKTLTPSILDMNNTKIKNGKIDVDRERMFESFESSPALKYGLSKAIEEINQKGMETVESEIKKKSNIFRKRLECFNQIIFYENRRLLSGINTFNIKGFSAKKVYAYLLSKKILCSVSSRETSMMYFGKKNLTDLVRISIHHYNTMSEIDYLIKCLIDLIKK